MTLIPAQERGTVVRLKIATPTTKTTAISAPKKFSSVFAAQCKS
ncbi:hypothetical protein PN456_00940 [Nodularia spumigena CS-586/05]|nr:hypothetical protein [Nodularia spumigena]MDB9338943.1 hypothetical protein [Nodularia spumigena CS-589/07]MDB9367533.1 hypothetical protein [Nodularia spumigena CS-586/05]MDB9401739.1 hypothetical protein [Microcystis aeruginosa CS-567/02-A1]MDB9532581.1 hypothetical protein [Nodularia spumigena CS-1038]